MNGQPSINHVFKIVLMVRNGTNNTRNVSKQTETVHKNSLSVLTWINALKLIVMRGILSGIRQLICVSLVLLELLITIFRQNVKKMPVQEMSAYVLKINHCGILNTWDVNRVLMARHGIISQELVPVLRLIRLQRVSITFQPLEQM